MHAGRFAVEMSAYPVGGEAGRRPFC